jgi:hypothetical protein
MLIVIRNGGESGGDFDVSVARLKPAIGLGAYAPPSDGYSETANECTHFGVGNLARAPIL